jgi:hypothetical protein
MPQQITQRQQGRRTDIGGGSKPRLRTGSPVKHPRRNLYRAAGVRTAERAAENEALRLSDRPMNGDATREPRMPGIQKLTEHRPVGVLKRCCIICGARIKRSAGGHRTRLTSANRRRRHGPPDAMPRRCCEFVDSRLRRSPPDRASAVPHGQAGENAMRFPHLAHRSAAAHKLHSATATIRYELDSGKGEPISRLPALAYSPRNLSKRPGPSH